LGKGENSERRERFVLRTGTFFACQKRRSR
jgi:hypothetical protein